MFFLQFCFRVMCFSFRVPLPPNFSNFSTQRCSERVLYSANTRALSGYAISGCINVPNNQLIPAHQPIHLARPFPTRTHHPILTRACHPPGPPSLPNPAQPGPPLRPHPAQPRPHSIPTRVYADPVPPQKIVGSAAAAGRACSCVARGRCQGGVQRHGSSIRASCSCVRAARGRHCCGVAAL